MKLNLKYVDNLPVVIINNYFDKQEYKKLTNFIFNLNPYMWHTDFKKSYGAPDFKNKKIKQNYSIQLDELYTSEGRKHCLIFNINRKLFNEEVRDKLLKENNLFKYLNICNSDKTFLNYYENNNLYDFHVDIASLTATYIFFKTPMHFTGGEFSIENKINIKPENNSMIIFPSFLFHKVKNVLMPENKRGKCLGRFSMTQFCTFK